MKTKIVFAGVMGAILMSVGANAATTSVATKGYVDQLVGTVNTTINNLDEKYVTIQQVTDAIENNVDLSGYQTIANITQTVNGLTDEQKAQKYPSVAAVIEAINSMVGLSPEQVAELKALVEDNGVVSQITTLQNDVTTLKGDVETLNGEGEGSVAKSIADAITAHTTAADAKYQEQSTVDFSIGTTDGKFRVMTDAEKAALASGVTAEKIADYDATKTTVDELTAADGTIAELQTAVDGLNGKDGQPGKVETIETTVTQIETILGDDTEGLVADVKANTDAIAENAVEIAKKITMPADCASGNKVCVLMVSDGDVSWTPVTSPVEDPVVNEGAGE